MVQPLITTSTAVLNFEATTVPPSAETKKITQLFSRNIRFLPVCRETIDALGRKMRLWEVPGTDFFCGTILHPNGQVTLIPAHKIINPLQGTCSIQTIRRIKQLENRYWELAYLETPHQLIIWPHIVAAAQDNGIRQSIFFPPNDGQVKHIFIKKKDPGHFSEDTSANRNLIVSQVRPENKIGNLFYNSSIEVYYGKVSDSMFVWVYVKANGEIDNAGYNEKPIPWETCPKNKNLGRFEKPGKVYPPMEEPPNPPRGGGRKARNQLHPASQPHPKAGANPANKNFQEVLQQTKLTSSYNTTHRGNPVPAKGGTGGTIGGVACGVDYIEGLFEGAETVFEKDHYFCVPLIDGQIPFSQEQLRQILRELAIGIYTHGAVPFFSLHFNQNAELFSVMHPAYQNTLVGRVIGMLDYFMKGYLNGGVFKEEFIDEQKPKPEEKKQPSMMENLYNWWWPPTSSDQVVVATQPTSLLGWLYSWWWSSSNAQKSSPLDKLIDFEEYCESHLEGEDKNYVSVSDLQHRIKISGVLERLAIALNEEEPIKLTDFDGFKNSFRIIAKQNSFQKEDNLFVIDADFDVFYTIEPSSVYQEKLDGYFREHGEMPSSYVELTAIYEAMRVRIHDHMVKMPMCREYFSMLGIINFFSSYFSTLKKHHKLPELAAFEKMDTRGCPALFPHLPLKISTTETLKMNAHEIIKNCLKNEKLTMKRIFYQLFDHLMNNRELEFFNQEDTQVLCNIVLKALESNVLALSSSPFKRFLKKNKILFDPLLEKFAQVLLNGLFKSFERTIILYKDIPYGQRVYKMDLIERFLLGTSQQMPNQIRNISGDIPYNGLFEANQISTEQLERNKRVVGGCGMRLEKQKVQSSSQASFILENNQLPLDSETWEKVNIGTSEGAVFRLGMEDIPSGIIDDYSWMESLLQEKIEPEFVQNWVEIQQAIELGDHKEFEKCVKAATDLTKIKGPNKTSLLHMTAKIKDSFYTRHLLEKPFLMYARDANRTLSVQARDANGYLPVHYAAMMGCINVLKLLVKEDYTVVDAVSIHGASALITAIQHNQQSAVSYLLKQKPKPAVLTGGYTELHCALHEGNKDIINLLLADPIALSSLNVCSEEGGTPLMLACELQSADLIRNLLAKGANASIAQKNGVTAIEIAVLLKSVEVLKALLENAKPASRALRAAAEQGTVEIIDLLLKKTDSIFNCSNESQDNLLHVALRHANLPVALYLAESTPLSNGQNIEKEIPLKTAILMGAWRVADVLYKKGSRISLDVLLKVKYNFLVQKMFDGADLTAEELQNYLNIALVEGNELAITEILRPKGAKLEHFQPVNGWEALHYLAKYDGVYLFKAAYAKDPLMPIKQEGNKTLAYIAAENASYCVFNYLLEEMQTQGSSLENHYKDRHLFYAVVQAGHMGSFEKMLEASDDLKDISLNKEGMRPVHLAAKMASETILKALEKKEADFTIKDKQNRTALYYAILAKDEACITFLIDKKIPVQAEDFYASIEDNKILEMLMQTKPKQAILDQALYLTVRSYNEGAFLRLQALGASFDHITRKGWTPTLLASYYGQEDILAVILQSNPIDQREMNGNNALHLACIRGHASCVKMLIQAGLSIQKPNRLGKTPQELAKDQMLVLHALKKEEISYPTLIENFVQALQMKHRQTIQECMEKIPQEEKIFIEFEGRKIWGTPLQIAIRVYKVEHFISRLLESFKIDPNLPDSEGNTLAHLLVLEEMDLLEEVDQLQLNLPNHQGKTPLHLAASIGNEAIIKKLIKKLPKEELNAVDHKGRTPVFSAIESRKKGALRLLAEAGSNLNCWDDQLITPLILACQKQSLAMVWILNENGVDLNQIGTIEKTTPLYLLIKEKRIEMARYLIMQGANPHILTGEKESPLHLAAQTGNVELLHLLRAKGVSLNLRDKKGAQIKHQAAMQGKIPVLETVFDLQKGLMDAPLDTPLELLKQRKDKEGLESLLEGIFDGATPVHLAAYANQPETVDWLIKQGANPEIKTENGKDALFFSTMGNNPASLVKQFTKYSFAQDPKSLFKALSHTIIQDNLDATKALYDLGVPINAFLANGNTGLHFACLYGALECTSWFLQQGADPLLENSNIQNAFQIAAENSSFEQFKALLEYTPIDLDEIFQIGAEPLIHVAAIKGNIKHVMLLIVKGATLDDIGSCGYTPFQRAIRANHIELAKLLLFCGANRYKRPRDESLEEIIRHLPEKSIESIRKILADFSALSTVIGESKLHRAVRARYPLGVRVLAQMEDLDQLDDNNQTALDLAIETNQKEVIRYLSSFFNPNVVMQEQF